MYLNYSLPFNSIDDDELEFIFGDFTRFPKDEDMDRLKRLKFNPFSIATDISYKTENFLSENCESQDCDYYLPNAFLHFHTNNLSIISLDIRGLVNKFDPFENLLDTLKQHFSIISLTETWLNDHNSGENFGLGLAYKRRDRMFAETRHFLSRVYMNVVQPRQFPWEYPGRLKREIFKYGSKKCVSKI